MTTQPEAARVERGPITEVKRFALGMADLLERQGFTIAAAELRRLHAECEHHKAWVAHITAENKSLEAQRDALLEEEILRIKGQFRGTLDVQFVDFARAIERAHGIGEQQ